MFIKNNHIANQLYVPYTKSIRALEKSARMLATGEKVPTVADGGGEMGVADRWQQKIRGTEKLVAGMESTSNYLATQDELLRQGVEILERMSELAASALDATKNTNDRIALDAEFQALENEFSQIHEKKYNGISLFGRSLDVRVGIDAADSLTLSTINLGGLVFTAMTLSQLASASAALISITSRISSLNKLKAKSGNNANEIERTIDFTRQHITNLADSENSIRGVDLAVTTAQFTKDQILLSAAQSTLSQSNGLIQSAMQFLG